MVVEPCISEDDAQAIIDALGKYHLTDQVSCLLSMIFSHVIAHCNNNMDAAEVVVQRILNIAPRQWELTKGLMQLESMQPHDQSQIN